MYVIWEVFLFYQPSILLIFCYISRTSLFQHPSLYTFHFTWHFLQYFMSIFQNFQNYHCFILQLVFYFNMFCRLNKTVLSQYVYLVVFQTEMILAALILNNFRCAFNLLAQHLSILHTKVTNQFGFRIWDIALHFPHIRHMLFITDHLQGQNTNAF